LSFVVIDTNIASFMFDGDTRAAVYDRHLQGNVVGLPFQVRAEMLLGAEIAAWGESRVASLNSFLASFITVPYSDDVVAAWVTIMARSRRIGRSLEAEDGWIAACALASEATLVAHDADFRKLGVKGLRVICLA
jgi:tRNA(fMet)-specific endonuclease VapC